MPDRDFEQQLRDGLHDWPMTPPPPVRDAVLEAVRRRRRRGLLWIPVGVLLLGAGLGGYYALRVHPAGSGGSAHTTAVATPEAAPATAGTTPATAGTAPAATPATAETSSGAAPTTSGATATTPDAITLRKTMANHPATSGTVPKAAWTIPQGLTAGDTAAQDRAEQQNHDLSPRNDLVALPETPWTPAAIAQRLPATADRPLKAGPARPAKAGGANPWSFRLSAAGGATGQGGFLSYGAPAQNQHVNFLDASGSYTNSSPAVSYSGTDTLAGRSAGWGWSVGMSAARRLSKRFRVEAGLTFTQAETHIGPVSDYGSFLGYTSANQATNAGGTGGGYTRLTYVNSYRLLSLPLDVSWSVAPWTRVQPSIYLGVAPAYLFSGDALMYNPGYSGYEVSKYLYRHWQFSGEMGFRASLLRFKGGDLGAGPFLQYGLSGLQKLAPVQDHLNYAGIRLDLLLPAKKSK